MDSWWLSREDVEVVNKKKDLKENSRWQNEIYLIIASGVERVTVLNRWKNSSSHDKSLWI